MPVSLLQRALLKKLQGADRERDELVRLTLESLAEIPEVLPGRNGELFLESLAEAQRALPDWNDELWEEAYERASAPADADDVDAEGVPIRVTESLDPDASASGPLTSPPQSGVTRRKKRLLVQIQTFVVVFIALSGLVAANEDRADKLGPYLGGSALTIAYFCAVSVGKAYDKLYPSEEGEE
ncbi:hypothetical protein [Nonomuraea typhae]|uniref:Transmembrane protein n=1 Tax=Nonomuraea typhae TaxID=2603600 RepID=A0ABW7YPG0_9ACTN